MKAIVDVHRHTVAASAAVSVLAAIVLQVVLGIWFVFGLPFMILLILVPVYCALYIYKSHFLLWVVGVTLVLGSVLFIDIMATDDLFQNICHDLSTQYHNNVVVFSSDGQLVCNYHNEDTIYAPAISSGLGMIASMGIMLVALFNMLQIPFGLVRLWGRRPNRRKH